MPLSYTISVSTDQKWCKLEFHNPKTEARAADLEEMISNLARFRRKMVPTVVSPEIPTEPQTLLVDAESPRFDVAIVGENPSAVVLAIAFPGLGVRRIGLTLRQARELGEDLILHSSE